MKEKLAELLYLFSNFFDEDSVVLTQQFLVSMFCQNLVAVHSNHQRPEEKLQSVWETIGTDVSGPLRLMVELILSWHGSGERVIVTLPAGIHSKHKKKLGLTLECHFSRQLRDFPENISLSNIMG